MGRDYSEPLQSKRPEQERAFEALHDWAEHGEQVTVLEYYSDHFMLSELFPPLLTRIHDDLQTYKKLNLCGVLNLIVPIHKREKWRK
ncbi:hypothetical protein ACI2OX_04115 [Bacillus sp. N9]